MHHPTDRITHTTAFVTPVMEHWLEREIAQWELFTKTNVHSIDFLGHVFCAERTKPSLERLSTIFEMLPTKNVQTSSKANCVNVSYH